MSQYIRCCASQLKNIIPTQHLYVKRQAERACLFLTFFERTRPLFRARSSVLNLGQEVLMGYKMETGYVRETWDFGDTLEVEEKHTGRFGAPLQKREKKRKATPEEIAKHNQWKRERDVRRLIKWNFRERDYWITLTYQRGSRPKWKKIKEDLSKLIRKVREKYKKQGWILKYIYRIAIGERGGAHVHILVNRESNKETATDLIIADLWESEKGHGHVNFTTIYAEGGYKKLAEYIVKPLEKWEEEKMKRYSCSRNLIRKDPKKKEIRKRALINKKGFVRDPKPPKGYYIDPESIKKGRNPITKYAYRHYTLIKIKKRD